MPLPKSGAPPPPPLRAPRRAKGEANARGRGASGGRPRKEGGQRFGGRTIWVGAAHRSLKVSRLSFTRLELSDVG